MTFPSKGQNSVMVHIIYPILNATVGDWMSKFNLRDVAKNIQIFFSSLHPNNIFPKVEPRTSWSRIKSSNHCNMLSPPTLIPFKKLKCNVNISFSLYIAWIMECTYFIFTKYGRSVAKLFWIQMLLLYMQHVLQFERLCHFKGQDELFSFLFVFLTHRSFRIG